MFATLLDVLVPVLLCIGAGFLWGYFRKPFDQKFVATFVIFVAAPCLIISALSDVTVEPSRIGGIALIWLCCVLGFLAVGAVCFQMMGQPVRTMLPTVMFPNIGNMGLPLCLFAFGSEGLALGVGILTVGVLLNHIVAPWLYSGTSSLRPILRMPLVYAALLAILLKLTDSSLPLSVSRLFATLGDATIPLMLLSLGVSLAQLRVQRLMPCLMAALVRLGGGLAIALLVIWLFGLHGVERGVVLVQAVMPTAVFNYMFALHFDRDPDLVAGTVVLSTGLAVAMLPLLLLMVL